MVSSLQPRLRRPIGLSDDPFSNGRQVNDGAARLAGFGERSSAIGTFSIRPRSVSKPPSVRSMQCELGNSADTLNHKRASAPPTSGHIPTLLRLRLPGLLRSRHRRWCRSYRHGDFGHWSTIVAGARRIALLFVRQLAPEHPDQRRLASQSSGGGESRLRNTATCEGSLPRPWPPPSGSSDAPLATLAATPPPARGRGARACRTKSPYRSTNGHTSPTPRPRPCGTDRRPTEAAQRLRTP